MTVRRIRLVKSLAENTFRAVCSMFPLHTCLRTNVNILRSVLIIESLWIKNNKLYEVLQTFFKCLIYMPDQGNISAGRSMTKVWF